MPSPVFSDCRLCGGRLAHDRDVDGVAFGRCQSCGSIAAEDDFLARIEDGTARPYDDSYWAFEMEAAEQRTYGANPLRVAEVFIQARRPITRFVDISAGSGQLLDALSALMPEASGLFWGVEPFPPPERFRTHHPHFHIGFLGEMEGHFDAGVCIEVIEHIPPRHMRTLMQDLAKVSLPGSTFYFNSSRPGSRDVETGGYLDPMRRGHIAAYSLAGLEALMGPLGFTIQPLPGRDWAFLAIFEGGAPLDTEAFLDRSWHPLPENLETLARTRFGQMMISAGAECGLAYTMTALSDERTAWARTLDRELETERRRPPQPAAVAPRPGWRARLRRLIG